MRSGPIFSGLLLALLAATSYAGGSTPVTPQIGSWGFDLTALDRHINPGDDFFGFANGAWLARTSIPSDRTGSGTFDLLLDKSEQDLKAILDGLLSTSPEPNTNQQRVADSYIAYLDTGAIAQAGLGPIRADLDAIAAVATHDDVARFLGRPEVRFAGPIAIAPMVDPKQPDRYAIRVAQAGLGLPNRDYYLDKSSAFAAIREKYVAYVRDMLQLVGYPHPADSAAAIMAVETRVAEASWPDDQRRDYDATYHAKSRAEALAFTAGFPLATLLSSSEVPAKFDRFIVAEDTAVARLAPLFGATPLDTWRAYLIFHEVDALADVLPPAFDKARFEFRGRVLGGRLEQRPRWKRALAAVNGNVGDALGQLYVAQHFTPATKASMQALVDHLLAAFRHRISALEWMTPDTRQAALQKLASFRVMIGYPDHWRSYQGLEIRRDDPVGNQRRASIWEWRRLVTRLDEPVDRGEWTLLAQDVNAENLAEFNAIDFPAAILQPPFFDPAADPAVNYGAIGGVIGHEITHGFDDQGAKLDDHGRLNQWWRTEDVDRFKTLSARVIAQYDSFEPLAGMHVRGANTIGENIADLGGMCAAHEAYLDSLAGRQPAVLDGFSGEQRFFLGWAQAWRELIRDETLRNRLVTDPHSPARYRVNGVVRNVDPWYDAFRIPARARLALPAKQRVRIW